VNGAWEQHRSVVVSVSRCHREMTLTAQWSSSYYVRVSAAYSWVRFNPRCNPISPRPAAKSVSRNFSETRLINSPTSSQCVNCFNTTYRTDTAIVLASVTFRLGRLKEITSAGEIRKSFSAQANIWNRETWN